MKLTDLNPRYFGHGGEGVSFHGEPVPERKRVGLSFDCPCGCGDRVAVAFSNPEDGLGPYYRGKIPTWKRTGTDFETMTLSPSILRVGGCAWHGWVRDGEIVNA